MFQCIRIIRQNYRDKFDAAYITGAVAQFHKERFSADSFAYIDSAGIIFPLFGQFESFGRKAFSVGVIVNAHGKCAFASGFEGEIIFRDFASSIA